MIRSAPNIWEQTRLIIRVSFVLLGAALIGSSLAITVKGQDAPRIPDNFSQETIRKLENHSVMIGLLATDITELKHVIRDQTNELNTIKGIGIGLGFLMTILHLLQFFTDKKLRFVETQKQGELTVIR